MSDSESSGTEWVRRRNTATVLRTLRAHGAASRAELATMTGLAKATIGTIVGGLEAAGAVTEEASREGLRGRPARPVALSGDRFVTLGLEINVDYVAAVVLDLAGSIVHHETRQVSEQPQTVLIALATERVAELAAAGRTIVGATVALPGLVSGDNRTVAWAPNIDVHGDDVARAVAEVLPDGCPLEVSNDADCAALGEAQHGAGADTDSLLYVTGTVGIGAGIIEHGVLVRGARGFAGEAGHLPIGDPDVECGCGRRGCWEATVGLLAMLRAVGLPEVGTPLESAEAVAAKAADDPAVRRALETLGVAVGHGLTVLTPLLDPAVVVLGGYFAPLGELVLEPARRTLQARLLEGETAPELRVGDLGMEAAALGAAERAIAAVFSGAQELPA